MLSAGGVAAHVGVGLAGGAVNLLTLGSAIRTVILPRAVPVRLGRIVFLLVRGFFTVAVGRSPSYERRDRVFAGYAPVAMLTLLLVWLLLVLGGGAAVFWAVDGIHDPGVRRAVGLSGSSLLTLGFLAPHGGPETALAIAQAALGLVLVALLITYLPSLYAAFSRREQTVSRLEVRAGSPPTGEELLWRAFTLQRPEVLAATFGEWEDWFVDVEETHSSFPMLVFFRSPQPDHSWVTSAGAILDAAALATSSLERPREAEPQLALRAGSICLRRLAGYYDIAVPPDPQRGDAITIRREEFEAVLDRLAAAGAPVKADRDEAWLDFAGWRVNYDVSLVALAALTLAPYAPWSSDRSLAGVRVIPRLIPRPQRRGRR